jgi:hypothetical protein
VSLPANSEHRRQNIDQRDADDEKTNGQMQVNVSHNPFLLGLFGRYDRALAGMD